MSPHGLPERLEPWAIGIIEALETDARIGRRISRLGSLGPMRVRHTFTAGSSHADLLDHLTGNPPPDAPEVTVHSVQLNLEQLDTPPLPWREEDFDQHDRPLGLDGSPWRLARDRANGAVRCYHRDLRVGLFITIGAVASWEFSLPMLPFWHWAAAASGAAMVHAGTIGTARAMGIVGGPGGTGKSTTVLLGMHAGLRSCGDDYVWLQPGDDGTQVWAVFRTIKTLAGSGLSPPAREQVREQEEVGKQIHLVPVATADPSALLPQATLRLAWVLQEPGVATRAPTRIEALTALLPSTLLRVTGDHATVAGVLRQVLDSVQVRPLTRNGDFDSLTRTLVQASTEPGVLA